jgi:hypothetical protein
MMTASARPSLRRLLRQQHLVDEKPYHMKVLLAPSGRSSDILAADHHDASRSQTALQRHVMPGRLGRSASSMPKNLRRPVRINIMSAARSQPDRIGPLCPIPNQSSPPFYHRLGGCKPVVEPVVDR